MKMFLFWIFLIVVSLGGYFYLLIRRSPRGYRLQVKLTTIFILLILIPTIPLTLLVSALFTQGVEMFLVPGVESSLETSLQILKGDLESRGLQFIQHRPADWSAGPEDLEAFDVDYWARFRMKDGGMERLGYASNSESPLESYDQFIAPSIGEENVGSQIRQRADGYQCEVYSIGEDSVVTFVGFGIDPGVVQARDQISESLKMYKSLSLFKDSIIQGELIWGLATLLIILLSLVAVFAARILAKSISDPIQQLAAGMEHVAEGDLSRGVEVKAVDEIKILVDSFNKMRTDLKTSRDKLVKAERLAAWRDVARRISHEIRNALTPIQLSLHRIGSSSTSGNSRLNESLRSIQDEMESLQKISEEFSQFARMPQVNREKNDLNDIIRQLIPLIEGESKPVKFTLDLDASLDQIDIDRDQIRRAVHNLIKNSVDASDVGSTITIRTYVSEDERGTCLEIRDRGCGMSHDVLKKIFEPYFTTKQRGMGLGLSIVRRIIEDHEGDIEITSAEGKGTRVLISLK
ncbi:MAG: ATP-binding protein [candidate division KSB1 bacterium]|jgi:nitrogen fixation/metabolism regulation signal transduction histidine kinase|nr:ATP-binding protein [candidate division KSB1 bacterium]